MGLIEGNALPPPPSPTAAHTFHQPAENNIFPLQIQERSGNFGVASWLHHTPSRRRHRREKSKENLRHTAPQMTGRRRHLAENTREGLEHKYSQLTSQAQTLSIGPGRYGGRMFSATG